MSSVFKYSALILGLAYFMDDPGRRLHGKSNILFSKEFVVISRKAEEVLGIPGQGIVTPCKTADPMREAPNMNMPGNIHCPSPSISLLI